MKTDNKNISTTTHDFYTEDALDRADLYDLKELERAFFKANSQNGIMCWWLNIEERSVQLIGGVEGTVRVPKRFDNIPQSFIDSGIVHKDSYDVIRDIFQKIFDGEQSSCGEIKAFNYHKNDYCWFEVKLATLESNSNANKKAICTSRDISEEKRLEMIYGDEMTYRHDVGSKVISWAQINLSKNVLEMFRIEDNDAIDKLHASTDYRERANLIFQDINLSDHDFEELSPKHLLEDYAVGRYRLHKSFLATKRGTDKLFSVDVSCHMIRRPNSNDVIAFFYTSDNTDYYIADKIAEYVTVSDHDYAGIIFSKTGYVKLTAHLNGQKISGNIYGYDYESGIEIMIAERINAQQKAEATLKLSLKEVVNEIEKNGVYICDFDYLEDGGSVRRKRWKFVYVDKPHGVIAITRTDIEEIIESEKKRNSELEKAVKKADRASAAKSDFLARMSHEIRTPLNGVLGLSELAREETDAAALKEYVEQISVSARHLEHLVGDILNVSKIESGELTLYPEPYSFEDFIRNIHAVIKPLCEQKKIQFVDSFGNDNYCIMIDKTRLNEIFINLLSNAVKFTPECGKITFSHHAKANGDTLSIDFAVKDTGVGMSKKFQAHMFEPFVQENNGVISATQGTGLGLNIAMSYVKKMNGTLTVESELNKGTTFKVHIDAPIVKEKTNLRAERKPIDLHGSTILVAEDHPVNRMIVVRLLEKRGSKVISVNNGKDALETFNKSKPFEISAILLDIRMPEMDGLETSRAIRTENRPDANTVPIIAMTANAYDEDRRKSETAGMNSHLVKPIMPQLLFDTLFRLIDKNK